MELLDLSSDVIRQIMIYYIDNSKVNQTKISFIGSRQLNEINEEINIKEPLSFEAIKKGVTIEMNEEDANYVDENGFTSLIVSCQNKMQDVALKLLEMNNSDNICKLEQVNKYGDTALMFTCLNNMSSVALELLNLGNICKPESITEYGYTALMWSCYSDMTDVALKILDMNCSPDQVDCDGHTALIFACKYEMSNVALKILDINCSLDQVDCDGKTALMYARRYDMLEVVARIENKVNINLMNQSSLLT